MYNNFLISEKKGGAADQVQIERKCQFMTVR
jgi:hypothetical protein